MSGANAQGVVFDTWRYRAALFDLDGVVTKTAVVHAAAWKTLFDGFLELHAGRTGQKFVPFTVDGDYLDYVDGKPRYDGVESFLAARGITLPYGDPADPPERETVCGLGNRKDEMFVAQLERDGVEVYPASVSMIRQLLDAGTATAIVSASNNCRLVLETAGIADLFQTRVDGLEATRLSLQGKPAPDTFLEAARRLAVEPAQAVVFEDALAGVEAGRRGAFGWVVGVDRTGNRNALAAHGADVVVADLGEIAVRAGVEP